MSVSLSVRHPTLYFPNGDIVLSASIDSSKSDPSDSHPKTQLFRVHKFLLTHHSATFANMFADANPDSGKSYDGVPMVELQGDKAEDFALLLNYLYNPTEMTFRRFDPNTPLVVSGVIRLADKYCIESLREHLIKVVVSDWPTTLEEWDFFQTEVQAVKDKLATTNRGKAVSGEGYQPLSDYLPEPASAIMFAQEFGCPQILRAAYYHLLSISPRHTWDAPWRTCSAEPLCARWSLLDYDSLLRCMKGIYDLLLYKPWAYELRSISCPSQMMPISGDRAFTSHPCVVVLRGLVSSVWSAPTRSERDPLGLLLECQECANEAGENHSINRGLCGACRSSLPDRIAHLRRELWDELSSYFDLNDLLH